jgi:serine protease Do
MACGIMDQILKKGKVTRGLMGILPQDLTPDMAKAFGMPNARGVAVASVEPDSPALKAGLKVGDVITAINGNVVEDVNAFRLQVAAFSPNTTIHLKVARGGQTLELPVTLAEFNMEKAENGEGTAGIPRGGEKGAMRGVSVQTLTPDIRQQLQVPEGTAGVIITDLDEDSPAAASGLQSGDVIVQVNHHAVNTVAEFNSAVKSTASRESTLLLVKRGQATQFVVVPNK